MSERLVSLHLPSGKLFVASYTKVGVEIDPSLGLTIDDLEFKIQPEGLEGGIISLSRDADFNPVEPDIMLCVGYKPDTYTLQALNKSTGNILGETSFTIIDLWHDNLTGPSKWFTGINNVYSFGSTWGRTAPGGARGPQNINAHATCPDSSPCIRHIAILLIDTSSQLYSADPSIIQSFRTRWMNEIRNGVSSGGRVRSVAHYYREVSNNRFDIAADFFGPVHLAGRWENYFSQSEPGSRSWDPMASSWQAFFSAGNSVINYNSFDTIIFVFPTVNATPPNTLIKFVWPQVPTVGDQNFNTSTGSVSKGAIVMPNDWHSLDPREIHQTVSHELGHNLGLGDLYTPPVLTGVGTNNRNLGSWDIMDTDTLLPHFSIAHKMILGWISDSQITVYNFTDRNSVNDMIRLQPCELGTGTVGLEIRITDGWNYYFEYRVGQSSQIGDRNLPMNDRVLGTDVLSRPEEAPINRPTILLLNDDEDGDGSVLYNGQNYTETDTTDNSNSTFRLEVSGVDGSKADVRVRYGPIDRPDPSIRPWPGTGPGRQWQSDDIEVRNRRSDVDSRWLNVPWVGHENRVIAHVKNSGDRDAPGVRVEIYVCDYNISGRSAPATLLRGYSQDIPVGQTVPYEAIWVPHTQGHFCIRVRIPPYQTPPSATPPNRLEASTDNNLAQSNYDRFYSGTSSPGSRQTTTIQVTNPYSERTQVFIGAGQSNPLYRSFIEYTSLTLGPGESRKVKVMFEYAGDTSGGPPINDTDKEVYTKTPNNVGLTGFIKDPTDKPFHVPKVLGGAQIEVATGRSTKFEKFEAKDENFSGVITTTDNGKRVKDGKIILTFTSSSDQKTDEIADVSNGEFSAKVSHKWDSVKAYFVAPEGYVDCVSDRIYQK